MRLAREDSLGTAVGYGVQHTRFVVTIRWPLMRSESDRVMFASGGVPNEVARPMNTHLVPVPPTEDQDVLGPQVSMRGIPAPGSHTDQHGHRRSIASCEIDPLDADLSGGSPWEGIQRPVDLQARNVHASTLSRPSSDRTQGISYRDPMQRK